MDAFGEVEKLEHNLFLARSSRCSKQSNWVQVFFFKVLPYWECRAIKHLKGEKDIYDKMIIKLMSALLSFSLTKTRTFS